jgi:hypothetical protein
MWLTFTELFATASEAQSFQFSDSVLCRFCQHCDNRSTSARSWSISLRRMGSGAPTWSAMVLTRNTNRSRGCTAHRSTCHVQRRRSLLRSWRAASTGSSSQATRRRRSRCEQCLFSPIFNAKTEVFTKTGSGHTQKNYKKERSCRRSRQTMAQMTPRLQQVALVVTLLLVLRSGRTTLLRRRLSSHGRTVPVLLR